MFLEHELDYHTTSLHPRIQVGTNEQENPTKSRGVDWDRLASYPRGTVASCYVNQARLVQLRHKPPGSIADLQ